MVGEHPLDVIVLVLQELVVSFCGMQSVYPLARVEFIVLVPALLPQFEAHLAFAHETNINQVSLLVLAL